MKSIRIFRSRVSTVTTAQRGIISSLAACSIHFKYILERSFTFSNTTNLTFQMSAATANRRTVRLNVSGTKYEVECSLIELYPNTMLARFVSERWRQSQNPDQEEIFIGRNGSRFEYILDYMRDRKVHLPATISKESFLQELHYYGC